MSRDFTLEKYSELCKALKSNYKTMSVLDYLTMGKHEGHIAILRHDVDKYPERSLQMAKLEHSLNITSTYYFRMVPGIFDKKIISIIKKSIPDLKKPDEQAKTSAGLWLQPAGLPFQLAGLWFKPAGLWFEPAGLPFYACFCRMELLFLPIIC